MYAVACITCQNHTSLGTTPVTSQNIFPVLPIMLRVLCKLHGIVLQCLPTGRNWGQVGMESIIGHGVYSITEAARYTKSSPQKLHNWFRDEKRHIFQSDYSDTPMSRAISFHDLIDALVVVRLRELNCSMHHIREVHAKYCAKWNTTHPFCLKKFYVDKTRKRVLYEDDECGENPLVDALCGQSEFNHIKSHLKQIEYSKGLMAIALRWKIHPGIVIDPTIRFGKPIIQGTGLTTQVIANQFYAYDKDAEIVADLFDITPKQVGYAVRFEKLQGTVKKAA